ncbi:hypothetical protein EVAR_36337_1 [Eumeta japonica]|uniref:Coiled-coil domain-containing protein 39 n=1 Tax=Eumeta variegata TaxID=151549 RepID=A0A4C1W749_EUMVA|nr:hypothetical protein EVAR_36337_1 [Eumeta japonica]
MNSKETETGENLRVEGQGYMMDTNTSQPNSLSNCRVTKKKLLFANKAQLEQAVKLKQLSRNEADRLDRDIIQCGKQSKNVSLRMEKLQKQGARFLKKADTLKIEVCGERGALEEWRQAIERSAEDLSALEKFTKQDLFWCEALVDFRATTPYDIIRREPISINFPGTLEPPGFSRSNASGAVSAAKQKHLKYSILKDIYLFIPVAWEIADRWDSEAKSFIRELDRWPKGALELKRQRLKAEHDRVEDHLKQLVSNLSGEERTCDRISVQMAEAMEQRKHTMALWSGAVENLRQRDTDIRHIREDYAVLEAEANRIVESIHEQQAFHEQQRGNNMEAERKNIAHSQHLSDIRNGHVKLVEQNLILDSESSEEIHKKPFKAAYRRECDFFMNSQLSERITPYDVASLVKKAFSSVASISKGEAGFRATGIFPINPNVFSDEDFLAAEVLQSEPIVVQDTVDSILESNAAGDLPLSVPTAIVELRQGSPIPSTSTFCSTTPQTATAISCQFGIPLTSGNPITQNFIKLPEKSAVLKTRQGRKKQHATILTSTPIKVEKKKNKRKAKALKGKGKGVGKKSKPQKRKPQKSNVEKVKKKILQESNDTSMSDVNTDELCQNDEDDDAEDAGDMCIVCGEFGRDRKIWYRCTSCGLWAHADCTGWDFAQNYVQTTQRILHSVQQTVNQLHAENRHINEEIKKKTDGLQEIEKKIMQLKEKRIESMDKSKSSEKRAKELEDMLNVSRYEEDRYANQLTMNQQRAMHCSYMEQKTLLALKNEEKLIIMQLKASKTAMNKYEKKQKVIEKNLMDQKEVLYGLTYRLETIAARVSHMEGTQAEREFDAEKLEREKRLKEVLARHVARVSLLERHAAQLNDDMRALTKEMDAYNAEYLRLQARLKTRVLEEEGGEKELRAFREELRRTRVEQALLRLRVAHAERTVAGLGNAAFSLETQRLQLDAVK